jgi:hypothetical protein
MRASEAAAAKVAIYVIGLVAIFVLAAGIGRLAEPLLGPGPPAHTGSAHTPVPTPTHLPTHTPTTTSTTNRTSHGDHKLTPERGLPWIPGGLQIAEDGYALQLIGSPPPTGQDGKLAFRIAGPDGRPVTTYTPTHEKPLHLVVVRRDLTHYRHVHPVLDTRDGTWSTPMRFEEPGMYRLFADFVPRGREEPLILGADLLVPGELEPAAPLTRTRTAEVDGYTVRLQGGLRSDALSPLTFTVTRNGSPVTDLQPYLGAYGHLVVLRSGDLAYLHVHPSNGPPISFDAEVPSPSTYRLFLDFRHDGVVRTAVFTVTAGR